MKVILAIPNYNMRQALGELLTSLAAEQLDEIYVLDDASTDGSADYVSDAFPNVKMVRGEHNVCAAANRNRLLPFLSGNELVLYMDADSELLSREVAQAVNGWFENDKLGLAGSLILDKSGRPRSWNYGWAMNPVSDARTAVYEMLARTTWPGSPTHLMIRKLALELQDTYNFEIACSEPVSRKVDWVSEGLFAVRADIFQKIGGFDERFRYHSGQDLGLRVAATGYEVRFEPGIAVRHLELDVRGARRWKDHREGAFLFYSKHWGMSRQVFDRLFPWSLPRPTPTVPWRNAVYTSAIRSHAWTTKRGNHRMCGRIPGRRNALRSLCDHFAVRYGPFCGAAQCAKWTGDVYVTSEVRRGAEGWAGGGGGVPGRSGGQGGRAAWRQDARGQRGWSRVCRRQNSLPSGSARTCQLSVPVWPTSAGLAPRASSRSSSASWSRSVALTSMCSRSFLVRGSLLGLRTRVGCGPPKPTSGGPISMLPSSSRPSST
jgi:GT2 family glycosyltransferase